MLSSKTQDLRIVSLVPSATLTACELGLQDSVVGCTNFCVKPKGIYKTAIIVGGTKDPDLQKIKELRPTHILVNQEENKPSDIEACRKIATVVESFPKSIRDSAHYVAHLGKTFQTEAVAAEWTRKFQQSMDQLGTLKAASPFLGKTYLYFVWRNPYIIATDDTYISRACELLGLRNAFNQELETKSDSRYPTLSVAEIAKAKADILLFSSEPYPFRKRDIHELLEKLKEQENVLPKAYKIDGLLCSWWGSASNELLEQCIQVIKSQDAKLLTRIF